MCGVSASLPTDSRFMEFALSAQQTRGPDESRVRDLGFAALGINRLSISGLVGGSQPLRSDDGDVECVFNGAIYNAPQLTERFELDPPSTNDGEMIAPLYQKFGLGFADHLEGMFAICLVDRSRRRLVLAVDPIGIKPLYYLFTGPHSLIAASDLRAFPEHLRRLAARLPAGTVLTNDGDWRRIERRYWSEQDLISLIRDSVVEQIPQEVPWGCMLSGGLDSSLVAALATESVGRVSTITCGFKDGSDLSAGAALSRHIASDHHEVIVDPEELPELVEQVVDATASMEPWTIMGGVGTYLVAREARTLGLKVLLSGEGADELFGGYDEFQDVPDIFLEPALAQYQADLGVSECHRLDRCTMAHGIEARVPYLCTSVIRHARSLPASMKIRRQNPTCVRKYALRAASRSVLPEDVAYRVKEEFSHGSGISSALRTIAESRYQQSAIDALAHKHPSFRITTPWHAWFFDVWRSRFGDSIGDDWDELLRRGIFRQTVSNYLPFRGDGFLYSPCTGRTHDHP